MDVPLASLKQYLEGSQFKWYFWKMDVVGVETTAPAYDNKTFPHHHVVAVIPIGESLPQLIAGVPPANPHAPMILDSFHNDGVERPWGVTLETFHQLAGLIYGYWESNYRYNPPTGTTLPAGGPQ